MTVFLNTAPNHDVLFDVIIVGAGLAGLRAAHDLISLHGIDRNKILIIDAQDYIGGRVRQADDFVSNGLIELGAEILHGEQTLLTQFAKEQGENIKPIYCWAHGDGGPMEEPVDGFYGLYYLADSERLLRFDTSDPDFIHLNEVLRILPSLIPDEISSETSLYDFLVEKGVKEEMLRLGRAGYANTSCSNLNSLSLKQVVTFSRQWDTEGEGDGDFKYQHTFKILLDFFKHHLQDRVLLNCPIQTITRHDNAYVSLEAKDGLRHFKAKKVIVTASVHVLQQTSLLTFNPPLPTHYTTAIENAVMHKAMKIFMQFSSPCWPVGLQGMIMAPPAEEEVVKEKGETPHYYIPESWFTCNPCAKHSHCYTCDNISERHHFNNLEENNNNNNNNNNCADCTFYCVGFVTSTFADNLDLLSEDSEICDILLKQLDKVFSKLQPEHWLLQEQHTLQVNTNNNNTNIITTSAMTTAETSPMVPNNTNTNLNNNLTIVPPIAPENHLTNNNNHNNTISTPIECSSESGSDSDSGLSTHDNNLSLNNNNIINNLNNNMNNNNVLPLPSQVFMQGRVQRWTPGRHPYIGGGYASAKITSHNIDNKNILDYARIYGEKGIDEVLYFAGEGVNYPAGGTAHAALESGVRVAMLVKDSLLLSNNNTNIAVVEGMVEEKLMAVMAGTSLEDK